MKRHDLAICGHTGSLCVGWHIVGILALSMLVLSCATKTSTFGATQQSSLPPIGISDAIGVQLPKDDPVTYRGVVSYDDAGLTSGAMAYPAVDAISFFAALLTHGALNESFKQGQKSKLEEAADKVLIPYERVLLSLTHRSLMDDAIGMMSFLGRLDVIDSVPTVPPKWQLKLVPVFAMTQDQSAIVLDNAVFILPSDQSEAATRQYIIRVTSPPIQDSDLAEYWMRDEGRNLIGTSASLLAQSLDIALQDATGEIDTNEGQEKTIRYREGMKEKMERGQVIVAGCERMLIRNLRGWLMSVPPSTRLESCNANI